MEMAKVTDIVGWTDFDAVENYCADCVTEEPANGAPIFAGAEYDFPGCYCDTCGEKMDTCVIYNDDDDRRVAALMQFLDIDASDADGLITSGDYLVLTDEEADEMAAEYIRESAWAFNSCFLLDWMPNGVGEEIIKMAQEKCESANEAILAMITDLDGFIQAAISADGRGHFLSPYDGEENEESVDGELFYVFRIN